MKVYVVFSQNGDGSFNQMTWFPTKSEAKAYIRKYPDNPHIGFEATMGVTSDLNIDFDNYHHLFLQSSNGNPSPFWTDYIHGDPPMWKDEGQRDQPKGTEVQVQILNFPIEEIEEGDTLILRGVGYRTTSTWVSVQSIDFDARRVTGIVEATVVQQ